MLILILLLKNNKINIASHAKADFIYKVAETRILQGRLQIYSDVIIDWIIAHNLINEDIKVRIYKESEINNMTDKELEDLYSFLSNGEDIGDRNPYNSVINILRFAGKLQYDKANITTLPIEIFTELLRNSDVNQITNLCNSSADLKQKCQSKNARAVLLDKIKDTGDNLDVSTYSNEQLIRYLQILPYKKRINTRNRTDLLGTKFVEYYYLNKERNIATFGTMKVHFDHPVNQVIKYHENYFVILDTNGDLNVYDLRKDTMSNNLISISIGKEKLVEFFRSRTIS